MADSTPRTTRPFWRTVMDRAAADREFAEALAEEGIGVPVQGEQSANAPTPDDMESQTP